METKEGGPAQELGVSLTLSSFQDTGGEPFVPGQHGQVGRGIGQRHVLPVEDPLDPGRAPSHQDVVAEEVVVPNDRAEPEVTGVLEHRLPQTTVLRTLLGREVASKEGRHSLGSPGPVAEA